MWGASAAQVLVLISMGLTRIGIIRLIPVTRCYPYPNRTVTVIMYLIRMTADYSNFLRTKKMALAAIFLWPLHQYHILRRHIDIF